MRSTSWDMNQRNCRFVVTDRCSDSSQHCPAEEVTWDSSSWVFKPSKFNIVTEKWWLEDYFPFKAQPILRGYVRFPESLQLFSGICYIIPQLPIVALLQCLRGYENWLISKVLSQDSDEMDEPPYPAFAKKNIKQNLQRELYFWDKLSPSLTVKALRSTFSNHLDSNDVASGPRGKLRATTGKKGTGDPHQKPNLSEELQHTSRGPNWFQIFAVFHPYLAKWSNLWPHGVISVISRKASLDWLVWVSNQSPIHIWLWRYVAWYRGFEFDRCQQLYSGNLLSEKGWSLDRTMDFFEHFFFGGGDVRQLMFVHFFWDASDVCSFFFCTLDVSDAKLFIFFCRDVSDFNVCLKVARFPVVKVLDFQGTDDAENHVMSPIHPSRNAAKKKHIPEVSPWNE